MGEHTNSCGHAPVQSSTDKTHAPGNSNRYRMQECRSMPAQLRLITSTMNHGRPRASNVHREQIQTSCARRWDINPEDVVLG
jgi:hypothetical protein